MFLEKIIIHIGISLEFQQLPRRYRSPKSDHDFQGLGTNLPIDFSVLFRRNTTDEQTGGVLTGYIERVIRTHVMA